MTHLLGHIREVGNNFVNRIPSNIFYLNLLPKKELILNKIEKLDFSQRGSWQDIVYLFVLIAQIKCHCKYLNESVLAEKMQNLLEDCREGIRKIINSLWKKLPEKAEFLALVDIICFPKNKQKQQAYIASLQSLCNEYNKEYYGQSYDLWKVSAEEVDRQFKVYNVTALAILLGEEGLFTELSKMPGLNIGSHPFLMNEFSDACLTSLLHEIIEGNFTEEQQESGNLIEKLFISKAYPNLFAELKAAYLNEKLFSYFDFRLNEFAEYGHRNPEVRKSVTDALAKEIEAEGTLALKM
jgi:hypothetical protein